MNQFWLSPMVRLVKREAAGISLISNRDRSEPLPGSANVEAHSCRLGARWAWQRCGTSVSPDLGGGISISITSFPHTSVHLPAPQHTEASWPGQTKWSCKQGSASRAFCCLSAFVLGQCCSTDFFFGGGGWSGISASGCLRLLLLSCSRGARLGCIYRSSSKAAPVQSWSWASKKGLTFCHDFSCHGWDSGALPARGSQTAGCLRSVAWLRTPGCRFTPVSPILPQHKHLAPRQHSAPLPLSAHP